MSTSAQFLTQKKIFYFWVPLAATWIMMSLEGPLLAAVIARMPDPKFNLAAYGVAFSFALIIEAPVIMMMSASTALVTNKISLKKLRNYTYILNTILTVILLILLIPAIFYFIAQDLIGLPEKVAKLTHTAVFILLPWPGAIGYRRFYQGILIRNHLTRRVAYGTIIRLLSVSTTAFILFFFSNVDGVVVGASALSSGVLMEAIAGRIMAQPIVNKLQSDQNIARGEEISYSYINKFYYPLALTPVIALGVHPFVTFFMGQSRMALESLAAFPVVNSLTFIFRSLGLSYQEVAISLIGVREEGYKALKQFALILGSATVLLLGLLAFTDLSHFWYRTLSGLSEELTRFSMPPTKILVIMPGLTVLISLQRAILVHFRKTLPITLATVIEFGGIVLLLLILINKIDMIGVIAAAIALVAGRAAANIYLINPYRKVLNK
jgi:hypothetical protein